MKKLFLALIIVLSTLKASQAQGFYFGPTAGINFSTLTKQTYSSMRVRGNIGALAGYQASNILAIQAEVLYSWQGTNFTNADLKYSFNYIKVPMLAKVFIIGGLNIEAGVSFNFLINAMSLNTPTRIDAGDSQDLDINITNDSRKFDFSIPIGINYLFFKKLELGLRYDISTVRVWQDADNKSTNSNLSLNLRYRF